VWIACAEMPPSSASESSYRPELISGATHYYLGFSTTIMNNA
jgi:hypothetical protein